MVKKLLLQPVQKRQISDCPKFVFFAQVAKKKFTMPIFVLSANMLDYMQIFFFEFFDIRNFFFWLAGAAARVPQIAVSI